MPDDLTALRELERVPLGLPDGLELEWLGGAGYRLSYEGTTGLVDPCVSRAPLHALRPLPARPRPPPALPAPRLIDRWARPADAFLTAHPQGAPGVDAPAIARRD